MVSTADLNEAYKPSIARERASAWNVDSCLTKPLRELSRWADEVGVLVELIVTDSSDPLPDEIRGRFAVSVPADIERCLRGPDEIAYGTHFLLRGHGIDMAAICVSERYLRPEEEGRFLLYHNGQLINEHATRNDVIRSLIGAVA